MASFRSQLFYLLQWIQPCPLNPDHPLERQRQRFEELFRRFSMPEGVTTEPLRVGGRPAEWLRPEDCDDKGAILYLHGGGYFGGSANTHRPLASRLSLAACAPVLLLEYRLAPEWPFPAALEDSLAAFEWLSDRFVAADKLVIAGDSAGGGLTLATCLALRDAGRELPAALVCLSPWTDLTGSGESLRTRKRSDPVLDSEILAPYVRAYLGEAGDPADCLISPLLGDFSHMPPLLIHVGDREILLSDSLRVADRAKEAGVPVTLEVWKGMWHVWHVFAGLVPEAQEAIDRAGAFVRESLARPAAGSEDEAEAEACALVGSYS